MTRFFERKGQLNTRALTFFRLEQALALGPALSKRRQGDRAVMLFVIQRSDGSTFAPAADIDPAYAEELRRATSNGVEIIAYRTDYQSGAVTVADRVDVSKT